MDNRHIPGERWARVELPPNWEQANGYKGHAPFIAIWWTDLGETVQIDDGRYRITAFSKPFFEDLIRLVVKVGGPGLYEPLGYEGETISHCLVADLEERSVHYAPLDEALTWLTQLLPSPDEESALSEGQESTEGYQRVCIDCGGFGWVRASERPEEGYAPCPSCDGGVWVGATVGYLQRVRAALEMEHECALREIEVDASALLTQMMKDLDGHQKILSSLRRWIAAPGEAPMLDAETLLNDVARALGLSGEGARAALGPRALVHRRAGGLTGRPR